MKNKKIVIALLVIVSILLGLMGKTYAANSFTVGLQRDGNDRVPKGSTFKITVKLSKINVGDGLSTFSGTLTYSDDILEIVKDSGNNNKEKVKGLNDWTATYNSGTGVLLLDTAEPVKNDVEICEIEFKVKENTTANTATIKLGSITGGNDQLNDPIKISATTTTVTIGSSTPSESEQPSQSEQPAQSEQPSQSQGGSSPRSSGGIPGTANETKTQPSAVPPSNTTRSEQDIPKSGTEDYIIPLIIAIAALGLISYVNYKKID